MTDGVVKCDFHYKGSNFDKKKFVPWKYLWDVEYSVVSLVAIKRSDCIFNITIVLFYLKVFYRF